MTIFYRSILVVLIIFILASAWSAIAPSHLNWGIHFAAFFEFPLQILLLLLSLLLLIPAVQNRILQSMEGPVGKLAKVPGKILFMVLAAMLVALWLSYPSKLHLLGDGALLLRSIPGQEGEGTIPLSFRNQPLVWYLYLGGRSILQLFMQPVPGDVYYCIDIVSGVLLIALIIWWMKHLQRPSLEKTLLGCLVLFCAGFQFFFGYVENYATQYVATIAFGVTGWFAMERKIPIAVPVLLFVLLIGLHLGSLVFLPAILYLLMRRIGRSKIQTFAIIGGACGIGVLLFFVMGFNISLFIRHFLKGSPDFLPLLPANSSYFAYSVFSFFHFADWVNSQVLIVPFGFIVPVLFFIIYRREIDWKDPVLHFLLITVIGGLIFTAGINSALGLARDWDLFASFFIPLVVLTVYVMQLPVKMERRLPILLMISVSTIFHTLLFVAINGKEVKHLARLELLGSPRFLSSTSRIFYDDALGNYFYDHSIYTKAKYYYSEYIQYDSVNPRILANLADSYRKLNEKDAYFAVLERTVSLGTPNPGVFSNLGVEYATRGDTARAIEMNLKCLAMDSLQSQAHGNLAILYLNTDKPLLAIHSAEKAIATGLQDPVMYRIKAKAYIKMDEYAKAIPEYDRYLALVPGDKNIREQRDRIAAFISQPGQRLHK